MIIKDTLDSLRGACNGRGISLLEGYKYKRKEYIDLLAKDVLAKGDWLSSRGDAKTWGLEQMLKIETPMLCYPWHKLKPQEQQTIEDSEDWIIEEKVDGIRVIMTYHSEEGFRFFTRTVSTEDYLPVDITDRILLNYKEPGHYAGIECTEKWLAPADYAGWLPNFNVVLDVELLLTGDIDVSGMTLFDSGSVNKTSLVLFNGSAAETKMNLKQAGGLTLVLLDVLSVNGDDLKGKPYVERRDELYDIIDLLHGLKVRTVARASGDRKAKQDFYNALVNRGEGVVYRNLMKGYVSTENRKRDVIVKRKKDSVGEEFDAFIGGVIYYGNDITALKLFVSTFDGAEKHVANAWFLPAGVKEQLMYRDSEGVEQVNEGVLGMVIKGTGYEFSEGLGMYKRVQVDWPEGIRLDKQPGNCDGVDVFGK